MSNIKHCGFCSLLSGLMRRAMCIGSRRGSSESYYRELGDQDTLKIDGSQDSEDSVEIHHDTESHQEVSPNFGEQDLASTSGVHQYEQPQESRPESPTEFNLETELAGLRVSSLELQDALAELETLKTREMERSRSMGRFHSMHKRRRRHLLTRGLVSEEALLDDLLSGQVQCVLEHSASWDFNAFTLDNVAGGRGLSMLCVHLFHTYGFISHFGLDPVKLWKLFTLFEENYHSTNPYHNSVHAADVTQAMHCFLQQEQVLEHMEPIEVMAGLLAAIAHDVDHPGVNQPFLVATSNHLVALYENKSVLENHHWRAATSCLIESKILDDMPEYRGQLQDKMRALILATDITRQQDYLGQFKTFLDTNTLDMTLSEHRLLVLQIALKCADISNPCRTWEISHTWSLKVCEEFFRQGDVERRLNLPLSPLCDRHTTSVPTIQSGFFKYVVTPLITEWHRFLQSDLSEQMLKNLVLNHKRWDNFSRENEEVAETPSAAIETEEEHEPDAANLSGSLELLLPRRSSLNPVRPSCFREQLRRFSVPLNVLQDGRPRNRDRLLQDVAGAIETDNDVSENDGADERDDQSPELVSNSEKLLAESSIASMTTPAQAQRINNVFQERNWRLIRQPTFPPLEAMSRAHSLIPRASSHDDSIYPRAVKSDSGIRLDTNQDENRPGSKQECKIGTRLRDNLTSIPLDLGRRRKSMPARAEPSSGRERRFRELREMLPSVIARTLSPRAANGAQGRRGSAPAPATGTEERAGARRGCQPAAPPHPLPRRSSLPAEVYLRVELSD